MVPIILCGGAGSRLWPLSTPSRPKPFHALFGRGTLYQQALLRATGAPFSKPPLVVAAAENAALAAGQAEDAGTPIELVLEQQGHDTCTAILAGVLRAEQRFGTCQVAVLAADHAIPESDKLRHAFARAADAADKGSLVLFGLAPAEARSSYGYIVPGPAHPASAVRAVQHFVEKPDSTTAAALIAAGALWNSGIFQGVSETFLREARRHAPDHLRAAQQAILSGGGEGHAYHLGPYGDGSSRLSFDRAVVEKSGRCCVLACDFSWNDLGTWDDVQRLTAPGQAFVHAPGQTVRLVGVDDLIVVSTPEGLLVTRSGHSQQLKTILAARRGPDMVNKP
jgi:mannose-1-phosphate guanylyltransferase / mannose-6-phosphate isomerase